MHPYTTPDIPKHMRGATNSWTPALAELSYKFSFVRLSVRPQRNIPELAYKFFF